MRDALRRLTRRTPQRLRVLVIIRGHIADLVCALPALRDLRNAYPDAHISAMVNEYASGALAGCPFVDEVIEGFAYAPLGRAERAWRRARIAVKVALRYDVAVSLRITPGEAPLLTALSGARQRVAFDSGTRFRALLSHDLGREPPGPSNRVLNAMPLEALGVKPDLEFPRINWVPESAKARVPELLARHGISEGDRFAVLQISTDWGCNEWRSDKWALAADALRERYALPTFVIGVGEPFELAKYEEVQRLARHPIVSLHGETSILELCELVARATLVVANDSALTAIALAQQTPSVILFGAGFFYANGPLPPEDGRLMEAIQHWEAPGVQVRPYPHCRFGESHCHTELCRETSCLQQTTVDEVVERSGRILGRVVA